MKPFAALIDDPADPSWLYILTPYNADFVDELKCFYYEHRQWIPERKCWRVVADLRRSVLTLMRQYYDVIQINDSEHRPPPPPPPRRDYFDKGGSTGDWATLGLAPNAPQELIKAAYRIMALKYHPDTGGDTAKMAEINAAYERLKR